MLPQIQLLQKCCWAFHWHRVSNIIGCFIQIKFCFHQSSEIVFIWNIFHDIPNWFQWYSAFFYCFDLQYFHNLLFLSADLHQQKTLFRFENHHLKKCFLFPIFQNHRLFWNSGCHFQCSFRWFLSIAFLYFCYICFCGFDFFTPFFLLTFFCCATSFDVAKLLLNSLSRTKALHALVMVRAIPALIRKRKISSERCSAASSWMICLKRTTFIKVSNLLSSVLCKSLEYYSFLYTELSQRIIIPHNIFDEQINKVLNRAINFWQHFFKFLNQKYSLLLLCHSPKLFLLVCCKVLLK